MHYNWIVYPEGQKRIKESSLDVLAERELKKHKKSLIPSRISVLDHSEILWLFDSLKEYGFFDTIPFDFVKNFGNDPYQDWHQAVCKSIDQYDSTEGISWEIQRHSGIQRESVSLEDDMPLLTGYNVSAVLNPKQFWNFKQFGFDSLQNFFGTFGAFIRMKDIEWMDKGYSWQSTSGKQNFEFTIGGSEHGDFRLKKVDITPYKTFDPTIKEVYYRPETNQDGQYVSASYSIEPYLLAIILKWAEQEKIPSEILKNYPDFISSIKGNGQICGPFGDFGFGFSDPRITFAYASGPIVNTKDISNTKYMPYSLPCYSTESGSYSISLGDEKQLMFSYVDNKGRRASQEPIEVPTKDFDNFFTGLFHQAQRGLGRTSIKNLDDVMRYYFSPQFKEDQLKQ